MAKYSAIYLYTCVCKILVFKKKISVVLSKTYLNKSLQLANKNSDGTGSR